MLKKNSPLIHHSAVFPKKDLRNASPETKYKIIESFNDYNYWLKQMLNKASYSLQIQILMPIYFESLVDLAFRIKLRKSLFNRDKIYVAKGKSYDIFENFEFLNIEQKIKEIKNKCFEVNPKRIDKFLSDLKEDFENGNVKKRKRNKLLHGNALLFRNLNVKFYVDNDTIIGFPNNGARAIAESINASVEETKLIKTIKSYEKQCNDFIDIFDDNGYFKTLVSSIMFAHNSRTGGCISTDISDYEHLYAPQKLD